MFRLTYPLQMAAVPSGTGGGGHAAAKTTVPGTPDTLPTLGEPWDTIAATLKNPVRVADPAQDAPADIPPIAMKVEVAP